MLPVLFIGHGSPMNAIESNAFTKEWKKLSQEFSKPKKIVIVSAHWLTKGTKIMYQQPPKLIYDFYGFPKVLYETKYDCPTDLELAKKLNLLIPDSTLDDSWGIDHGAWSILKIMYPNNDIPVVQVSLDYYASNFMLYELGEKLKVLREEDVLIIGSGNIVHNLRLANFQANYPWASTFDNYIYQNIIIKNHKAIINYDSIGEVSRLAVPTTEHFNPLLVVLGATNQNDEVIVRLKEIYAGSISMTSYLFKEEEKR